MFVTVKLLLSSSSTQNRLDPKPPLLDYAPHNGSAESFRMSVDTLARLAATISSRRASSAAASYTKSLFDKGTAACAKKFGEEAVETAIAAVSESEDRLCSEAADLLYHLIVLLESRNLPLERVLGELERRMRESGHAEKAARAVSGKAS